LNTLQAAQKIQPYPAIQQQPQHLCQSGLSFLKHTQVQAVNQKQTLIKVQQLLHSVKRRPHDTIPPHIAIQALQLLSSIPDPSYATLNMIAQMTAQVQQQTQPSTASNAAYKIPYGPVHPKKMPAGSGFFKAVPVMSKFHPKFAFRFSTNPIHWFSYYPGSRTNYSSPQGFY